MAEERREDADAPRIDQGAIAIPDIYFNGMDIGLSLSDVGLLVMTDGQPRCKLHMSFTTAKTLAKELGDAVAEFERLTEHSIVTMDEVRKGVKRLGDE